MTRQSNDSDGAYRDEDISGGKITGRERVDNLEERFPEGACSRDTNVVRGKRPQLVFQEADMP
jgi:hypothetical protein